MSSLTVPESSNSTVRPHLLIRAKSGTITETLTDAFTLTFRRRTVSRSASSSSTPSPSEALSKLVTKITLKDIHEAKRCGGGGFGTVRIFEHPTKGKVALKQLRVSGGQRDADLRRRTLREGETWQDLKHPCVLPFLGILETPIDLYLVSPYVENGSLDNYLLQHPDADRQAILWEAAGAIAYLHKCGIVHGDIKAANILVSENVRPLICDFGLAKFDSNRTSIALQGVGTVRFQSPEVLTETRGKSFTTDIWAFGMTISQVLTGNLPYHQYKVSTAIISAVVLRDERPPTLPSSSPSGQSYNRVWNVAQVCWRKDPAQRSTMQKLHRRLRPKQAILWGHTSSVTCLAFLPDGMTIVTGSRDSTLRIWEVASGSQKGEPLEGHTKGVSCLVISPDGKTVVSGSEDNTLRQWDASSGRQSGTPLEGHTASVTHVAISPDGKTIVSGSIDHTIRLWDVASQRQRGEPLYGFTENITCLAISPDGMNIVSGYQNGALQIWDLESGNHKFEPLDGGWSGVACLAISPDGTTVVSGSRSYNNKLQLWDMASGRRIGEPLKGHSWGVSCLAISPDGKTIVSGSEDGTLRMWDMESGRQTCRSPPGHTEWVSRLVISPDGKTVVSGSGDGTVRVWDMASGDQRGKTLFGHRREINSLAISPDGTTVASGSGDGTLRLWKVLVERDVALDSKSSRQSSN